MARVQTKSGKLKLVHRKHTGQRLAHKHTSYHGLAVVLGLAAAVIIMVVSLGTARADSDFGVTASVYAPPPGQAAQISQPNEGDVFTSNPITVAGTCEVADPANVVKIYSNNQLIGSTTCSGSGTFGVQVDLFSGDNTLVPHIYTFQGVEGPVGNPVHVRLNIPPPSSPPSSGGSSGSSGSSSSPSTPSTTTNEFRLSPSEGNLFFVPDKPLDVVFTISGGTAPYSIQVDWGDGSQETLNVDEAQEVKLTHTYHGIGPYTIQIKATDASDTEAHLELVAVSGVPTGGNTSNGNGTSSSSDSGPLAFLRRISHELFTGSNGVVMISYFAVSALTISFWVGEHWFIAAAARRRNKPLF